ncbi:MAG: hypothetical protein GX852_01870 [Clostridiales bacterium]|jgi:putative membrane protein|nr:hypothetical protein [Clostridiales bacterium]
MKNGFKKQLSILLTLTMIMGAVSTGFIYGQDKSSDKKTSSSTKEATTNDTESEDVSEDETVYVVANANGNIKKVIVSDWIKNKLGATEQADSSDLTKADENNALTNGNVQAFDIDGNALDYQGNIENEVPVDMTVSYKLDGKNISADKLAGQSGHVTIRFDYKNKKTTTVNINGTQTTMYVPFAMLTGMILDNNVFSNVSVTNGKFIDDGSRTIVSGIAFPGMQSNLGVSSSQVDIPEYFEVSADVTDFEMSNTMTIATNEIFKNIDTSSLSSIDDLKSAVDQLSDATNELVDGSNKLYEGLSTLQDKSSALSNGVDALYAGGIKVKDGAGSVNSGAEAVSDGATQLQQGLTQLASQNETLMAGAESTFEALLSNADTKLAAAGVTAPQLTIANYDAVLTQIIAGASEPAKTQLGALKDSLDQYNKFYVGLKKYTDGVSSANQSSYDLADGAGNLYTGTKDLYGGASSLYDGVDSLHKSTPTLISGVADLKNGSKQLSEGIKQFKEDGIDKLVEAVNGDVSGLLERVKAISNIAKNYKAFPGVSDLGSSTKFVYKTDAIEVKEDK